MTLIGSAATGAGDVDANGQPTNSFRTGAQSVRTEGELGGSSPPAPSPASDQWARFKASTGVTRDVDDFVSAWADISGNARHLTQAAISGPMYIASGINGKPSVAFDGANGLQNLVDNLAGARTLYLVARPDGPIGGTLFSFRRSVRDWTMYSWLFAGTQYVWSDGVTNIATTPAVNYSTAPHLYTHQQDGSNVLTCRVDLSSLVTVPTPGITTNEDGNAGFTLGGREVGSFLQGFDGMISEAIIYSRVTSGADDAQNLAYAAAEYGVAT